MKELEDLLDDLQEHLRFKEIASTFSPGYDSYIHSELQNRYAEIMGFEESIKSVDTNPLHKRDIVLNFMKEALEIKKRIAEIPRPWRN